VIPQPRLGKDFKRAKLLMPMTLVAKRPAPFDCEASRSASGRCALGYKAGGRRTILPERCIYFTATVKLRGPSRYLSTSAEEAKGRGTCTPKAKCRRSGFSRLGNEPAAARRGIQPGALNPAGA
jgi:hypothetical protein